MPSRPRFQPRNPAYEGYSVREASPYGSNLEGSMLSFSASSPRISLGSNATAHLPKGVSGHSKFSLPTMPVKTKTKSTIPSTNRSPEVTVSNQSYTIYPDSTTLQGNSIFSVPTFAQPMSNVAVSTRSNLSGTNRYQLPHHQGIPTAHYILPSKRARSLASSRSNSAKSIASRTATTSVGRVTSTVKFDTTSVELLKDEDSDEDGEAYESFDSDASSLSDNDESDVTTPDDLPKSITGKPSPFGTLSRPDFSRGISEGLEDCSNNRLVLAASCEKMLKSSMEHLIDSTVASPEQEWHDGLLDGGKSFEEHQRLPVDTNPRPGLNRGVSEGLEDISNCPLVLAAGVEKLGIQSKPISTDCGVARSKNRRVSFLKQGGKSGKDKVFQHPLRPHLSRGVSQGLEDCSNCPLVLAAAKEKRLTTSRNSQSIDNFAHIGERGSRSSSTSSSTSENSTWKVDCFESDCHTGARFQLVSNESTPAGTRRGSMERRA